VSHEAAVGRVQFVEARGDERGQRLGDGQVRQVVDGSIDPVLEHQAPLRQEHAHGLHGVQRDPVGPGHDRVTRDGGQPGDESAQQFAHRLRRQRVEMDGREAARAGAPIRSSLQQLGT